MDHVNIKVKVSSVSEPKQIIAAGTEREILEVEVGDETGSITLVLWDDKIVPLKDGDALQIVNGFVSSFRGKWRINVGKYGEVTKT